MAEVAGHLDGPACAAQRRHAGGDKAWPGGFAGQCEQRLLVPGMLQYLRRQGGKTRLVELLDAIGLARNVALDAYRFALLRGDKFAGIVRGEAEAVVAKLHRRVIEQHPIIGVGIVAVAAHALGLQRRYGKLRAQRRIDDAQAGGGLRARQFGRDIGQRTRQHRHVQRG